MSDIVSYENVSIPFRAWGNRQVLYEEIIHEKPWLRDFIAVFPNCFEYDQSRNLWVFYPQGDKP